jgi:urease subunit alpha
MYNDLAPKIEVDPETYEVKVDGKIATTEPVRTLSMARLYNLF